jgi:hypothetical protein
VVIKERSRDLLVDHDPAQGEVTAEREITKSTEAAIAEVVQDQEDIVTEIMTEIVVATVTVKEETITPLEMEIEKEAETEKEAVTEIEAVTEMEEIEEVRNQRT